MVFFSFIQTQAKSAANAGNDNLLNALKIVGPNTYFVPADVAFQAFANPTQLSNFTFLYEILFKSHRISNQILFDYYFDGTATYYTDTLLPVSTVHRRLPGTTVDDISIEIGHVRGKIIPTLRNILCWSGIIHVIDTVLAIPSLNAYQQISATPGLTSFKSLIDNSPKYSQLLQQIPANVIYPTQPPLSRNLKMRNNRNKRQFQFGRPHAAEPANKNYGLTTQVYNPFQQQYLFNQPQQQQQQQQNQQQNQQYSFNQQQQQQGFQQSYLYNSNSVSTTNLQYMTILAVNDAALFNLYPILLANSTAIDQFLSTHIIIDSDQSQNRNFYTDHDANTFQNAQVYTTLNPNTNLIATVTQMPNEVAPRVSFQVQNMPSVQTRIVNGNYRVANGVVHIVDKPLMQYVNPDITVVLDKYTSSNTNGLPSIR